MVQVPERVSKARRVVPEYTTRSESSDTEYSSMIPRPLRVFQARHTPLQLGGAFGAFDVTSTVHLPTRKSNCEAPGGGAAIVTSCCATERRDAHSAHTRMDKSTRARMSASSRTGSGECCGVSDRPRRHTSTAGSANGRTSRSNGLTDACRRPGAFALL